MVYVAVKIYWVDKVSDYSSLKDDNGIYPGVRVAVAFAEETAALTGLPLVCTTCRNDIEINNRTGILPVEIYVKLPWD